MEEKIIDFEVTKLKTFPMREQFKTPLRNQLKEEEQCLLDNLWNLSTTREGNSKKVAVINALASYFATGRHFNKKPFTCYTLFTGPKAGVYLEWDEMAILLEEIKLFPRYGTPMYKGFFDIQEAIDSATKSCGNDIIISPRVQKYQEYLRHLESFNDQEFLHEIQKIPKDKGKEISLRPQLLTQKTFSDTVSSSTPHSSKTQKSISNLINLGKPTLQTQPKTSMEEMGIKTFILLQDVLSQICNNQIIHNGISTEWEFIYNNFKTCQSQFEDCPENQEGDCSCQLDVAIRKARISIPTFKPFKSKDYPINVTNLLKHGLVSTINIQPLYEYHPYLPSFLADTLETIIPEYPQKTKIEISSIYPDFQNNLPSYHTIWLYFKSVDLEYEEFQIQNSGPKHLHLEDVQQQVEISRAKTLAEDFTWTKLKMEDRNLLREDKFGKIYCNSEIARNFFFPFEVKHSRPKLVEIYKKRRQGKIFSTGSSSSSLEKMLT